MGSNDLNYSLVSNKTLSQKIGSFVWLTGPGGLGKIHEPTPIMSSPTRKPKT